MPYKDKEKAKQYQKEYNKKRPVMRKQKCDLCNFDYAETLTTVSGNTISLCPNHLIAFVMRDLEKQDAITLRTKYGKDEFWIDDQFYTDDGLALQPA